MVKVRDDYLVSDGHVNIDAWIESLTEQVEIKDEAQIREACDMAQAFESQAIANHEQWNADISSLQIATEMTQVLAELHMDQASIVAAILYRPVREGRLALELVTKKIRRRNLAPY